MDRVRAGFTFTSRIRLGAGTDAILKGCTGNEFALDLREHIGAGSVTMIADMASVFGCVLSGRSGVYASAPITSGLRAIEAARHYSDDVAIRRRAVMAANIS